MGFPGSLVVKNLPAIQETWVQFLSQEDPLGEEMATHSSILAWRKWQPTPVFLSEETDRLHSPWGQKRVTCNLATKQQEQQKRLKSVTLSGHPGKPQGVALPLLRKQLALTRFHVLTFNESNLYSGTLAHAQVQILDFVPLLRNSLDFFLSLLPIRTQKAQVAPSDRWVEILALPPTCCMTLGESFGLPQISFLLL